MTTGAPPRPAVWLLTAATLALAAGSTAALAVLAFAGLSLVPAVARFGDWSPQTLQGMEIASVPIEAVAGLALAVVLASTVLGAVRYCRWLRSVVRTIDQLPVHAGLVVLPDAEPLAFAVPLRGGRIVVSWSMLSVLTPAERCALLAHERVHLRCRHHLFLAVVSLSTALNPLLWPLRSAVVFLVERWADEVTCARLGDRRVVASAVGKAALATRTTTAFAPGAAGGPVPRRVAALLEAPPQRSGWGSTAALCTAVTIAITAWSMQASVEAAADLHNGIEVASLGHHHHHRPMA
jgi:hypothetical protein